MISFSIIGASLYGNRGAEAMLSTTIGILRKYFPQAEFNVFSYYPQKDKSILLNEAKSFIKIFSYKPIYLATRFFILSVLYKIIIKTLNLNYLKRLFPLSVKCMAESKAIICIAGVSFIDGREKYLIYNIFSLLPPLILNVPIIKLSQALGPFHNPLNKYFAKIFLPACKKIFTRGNVTHSYFEESFPSESFYQRADDIVFIYDKSFSYSIEIESDYKSKKTLLANLKRNKKILVGICPSSVIEGYNKKNRGNYLTILLVIIEDLIRQGYIPVVFPNATKNINSNKKHNNDLPLIRKIQKSIYERNISNCIIFNNSLNAKQIVELIEILDINVVSRFHSMIFSLICGVIPIVIGWSHKYLEVMSLFQLENLVMDFKSFTPKLVVNKVNKCLQEKNEFVTKIKIKLPFIKETALSQFKILKEIISL